MTDNMGNVIGLEEGHRWGAEEGQGVQRPELREWGEGGEEG